MGAQKQSASEALEKFFPPRYKEGTEEPEMESCLIEKWASLRGKSVHDCVRIYLNCTRKWQFFGAQLFNVQVSCLCPFENGPTKLHWAQPLELAHKYPFPSPQRPNALSLKGPFAYLRLFFFNNRKGLKVHSIFFFFTRHGTKVNIFYCDSPLTEPDIPHQRICSFEENF